MRTKLLFTALFAFIGTLVNAQDLTLGNVANSSPSTLPLGGVITINTNVQNIGSATAGSSHLGIYINTSASFTGATQLGVVSVESLAASKTSSNIQFVFPIPPTLTSGTYYVLFYVDVYGEVAETNETNNGSYINIPVNITSSIAATQNLPYPMIFIHGLNSNSLTWDSLLTTYQNYYGWSYGGNMDFCLNADGNLATSNINTDFEDFNNPLAACDFYTVNFDINPDGSHQFNNTVESNQSAVLKQGYAVRNAIAHVLQVTGRDKVILVAHSMGGLAAREYLEDSSKWQSDGQHHVAKLFTVGTPHYGSDESDFIGVGLDGIDLESESVRDLRTTYFWSNNAGVYLFGGLEDLSYMRDEACCYFNNADVNCNGIVEETDSGLNQKSIPNNLSYACVIGTGNIFGGDAIVSTYSANLNNIYPTLNADTFMLVQPAGLGNQNDDGVWHEELTEQIEGNVQGIDEPEYYDKAYGVDFDNLYFGLISPQSLGSPYVIDYDDYTFNLPSKGTLAIQVFDITLSQYEINVLDAGYSSVFSIYSNGKSYIDTVISLNSGQYYFELSGTPNSTSWYYPYAFQLNYTPCTLPAQAGNILGTSPVCLNSLQTYSVNAVSGATSYTWTLPSGWSGTSSSNSINVTVGSNAGNICVTANNDCGSSSQTCGAVAISPLATVPNISGTTTICAGQNATLSVSNPCSGCTYNWSDGKTGQSISDGIAGGVTATATNGCGTSSNSNSLTITVNPLPTVPSISGNTTICSGQNATLTVSNPCNGCTYNWSDGKTGQSISDNTSGAVTATATNGCGTSSNSNSLSVTVNTLSTYPSSVSANPNPVVIGNATTLSIEGGSLGTGATWKWYSGSCGGTLVGTGDTIYITPSSATTYYARAEGTCDTTNCASVSVNILTGLTEENISNVLSIYPNPSDGIVTIASTFSTNNFNIKVMNVLGQEIYQAKMLSKTMDIDLSKQANGIYFVQVSSDNGSVTKKVVLNK